MFAKKIIALFALILAAAGCARQISPNVYSGRSVGESTATYAGVIVSARQVNIQDSEYLEGNGLGLIGGGIGGAVAGSQFGKGRGNTAATIAGTLIGATAGAFAEQGLKSQTAIEYIVELENGEAVSVVQGPDSQLFVGESVWLMVSNKGRSRITPR